MRLRRRRIRLNAKRSAYTGRYVYRQLVKMREVPIWLALLTSCYPGRSQDG